MGCMENALSNLFPTGWLDPYGHMPLNDSYSVQIDITQVETDDGIKVTAVKTPPRASTTSIQDAISMALGMGCCENEAYTNSPQSVDQGKRQGQKDDVSDDDSDSNDEKQGKSDIMKPSSSGGSGHRDRNLGSQGSRPGPPDLRAAKEDEDAKEKAPK